MNRWKLRVALLAVLVGVGLLSLPRPRVTGERSPATARPHLNTRRNLEP